MQTHVVEQGECLSSIARAYGLPSWRIIYNDPANADFRNLRPNPNVILTGDILMIPEAAPRTESRGTLQRHPFVLKTDAVRLRIVIADHKQRPVGDSSWRLEIGSLLKEGTTGTDGLVDEAIPADALQGRLEAVVDVAKGTRMSWSLALGALDPWDSDSGAQGRLNNLGFPCGRIDGIVGRHTRAAAKLFQTAYRLSVDGIPGPITKGKLRDVHGC